MPGKIYVGVGGWTFEPWRGVFYPDGLPHKRELEYASSQLTSIEINGTYYSTFKRDSWDKWAAETPEGFRFSVKGSRFCTNRRELSGSASGASIAKFVGQGLGALGDKLGPLNWQFMATKKFDPVDFEGFLKLLPEEVEGRKLRHALEVRHPSFCTEEFYDLARRYGAAIVFAEDEDFPKIEQETADFTYARLMASREDLESGLTDKELDGWAEKAKAWARRGDVYLYFISGAKVRNPAAARALIERLR
jgi:uncharacterized protein YecE (DUF72 family)